MANLCRAAQQDFYAQMARLDNILVQSDVILRTRPSAERLATRNDSLHRAMGYRADQPEY